MSGKVNPLRVLVRLFSWFLVLLVMMMIDLGSLAHVSSVRFPSDSSLKIHLPEWLPRERQQRDAWKHSRMGSYDGSRRGKTKADMAKQTLKCTLSDNFVN